MRSLTNTSTGAIGGIDKKLTRAVLLIMLITARDLQSVLSIKQASTQKEVGFHFDGNDILLNVAPEPTTLSPVNNELLLPVSSVISITLPEHLVTYHPTFLIRLLSLYNKRNLSNGRMQSNAI